MNDRIAKGFVYHIYPLGLLGCPRHNEGKGTAAGILRRLYPWLEHARGLGATAIWLGPLFESSSHGYDTIDYGRVDSRLGTNDDLRRLVDRAHELGLLVILDAVFNHTGLEHPFFRRMVMERRPPEEGSWYKGVDFSSNGQHGIPFRYQGWAGCMDLAKLDLDRHFVRDHLTEAARRWIRDFGIDGLRLDAADLLPMSFMAELSAACRREKEGFWLMGEVVHGDYGRWIREGKLDSVTNYECYKGLHSSFNDVNMHEIAHSLRRQFADGGVYHGMELYSFADNHDVSRIATTLKKDAHIHPLHILLFTMPGIPSIYYGSEWGIRAAKGGNDDWALRPPLDLPPATIPSAGVESTIKRLSALRMASPALRSHSYRELAVSGDAFAFMKTSPGERVIVAVNASSEWRSLELKACGPADTWSDLLDDGLSPVEGDGMTIRISVPPLWGRIIRQFQ